VFLKRHESSFEAWLIMMNFCVFLIWAIVIGSGHWDRPFEGAGLKGGTRHAVNEAAGYKCGTFGDRTYRLPDHLAGIFAGYEADEPWSPQTSPVQRTCTDRFRSALFRACLPNLELVSFSDWKEQCPIMVHMSSRLSEQHLEKWVHSRRRYNVQPDQEDQYDESLNLYTFDENFLGLNRVFWRPASFAQPYIMGRCSIYADFPQCEFETYSFMLGASLSISFPMKYISSWEAWVRVVELKLAKFQVAN
jgi:hypothetical protein